jgi:hypothetical protein
MADAMRLLRLPGLARCRQLTSLLRGALDVQTRQPATCVQHIYLLVHQHVCLVTLYNHLSTRVLKVLKGPGRGGAGGTAVQCT